MQATLTFKNRPEAENFAKNWSRYTKTGHTIGAGIENVKVTIYNIDDDKKNWIDSYVNKLNS